MWILLQGQVNCCPFLPPTLPAPFRDTGRNDLNLIAS